MFPTEKNEEMIEIEKVYTQFLKRLLGVNISVTNAMIRAVDERDLLLEKVTTSEPKLA